MPNGHANEPGYQVLIAGYEEFFSPFKEVVLAFANRHNLLLDKYYHDAPDWSLCFLHPANGHAKISLSRTSESEIHISGLWWIDHYDSFTRYIRTSKSVTLNRLDSGVRQVMEDCLSEVLSWKPENWTQVVSDYKRIWICSTKEEFEAMAQRWPRPVL